MLEEDTLELDEIEGRLVDREWDIVEGELEMVEEDTLELDEVDDVLIDTLEDVNELINILLDTLEDRLGLDVGEVGLLELRRIR